MRPRRHCPSPWHRPPVGARLERSYVDPTVGRITAEARAQAIDGAQSTKVNATLNRDSDTGVNTIWPRTPEYFPVPPTMA